MIGKGIPTQLEALVAMLGANFCRGVKAQVQKVPLVSRWKEELPTRPVGFSPVIDVSAQVGNNLLQL